MSYPTGAAPQDLLKPTVAFMQSHPDQYIGFAAEGFCAAHVANNQLRRIAPASVWSRLTGEGGGERRQELPAMIQPFAAVICAGNEWRGVRPKAVGPANLLLLFQISIACLAAIARSETC